MKKTLLLVLSIFSFAIAFGQSNIFFSQYAEGSSNNKFLEIYNASDEVVDLTLYAYPSVANDPTTPGEHEYWNGFEEGASVAPGDVYVISHGSADDAIIAEADEYHTYLSNGDDGYKLVFGTEDSFVVVDALGDWMGDPGAGWDVAGVENATKDHTLVRKSSVTSGNPDWTASAGTNADDSEWIVLDNNDWTGLGSHTMDGPAVDADCEFDVAMSELGSWPGEISYTITNAAGEVVLSGDADTVAVLSMSYGETYTLTMIDSFGDGWNSGVLSIGGNEYTFDEGAQATAEIACESPAPPTCPHGLLLSDSFGDGWNGGQFDVAVDGEVVLAGVGADFTTGASTTAQFDAEEGKTISFENWVEGSWPDEISWTLYDGTGLVIASGVVNESPDVAANCTEAACPAPLVTAWSMTATGVEFDGTNQESILSYTVEYSEEMFTPGDGTAMTHSFDSFPATLDGLTPATTYYFAMVGNCAEGLTSNYIGGPDAWTTDGPAVDADCEFDVAMSELGSWPGEISYTITNAAGEVVLSGDADTVAVLGMSYGETYTLTMSDSFGDGWNGGVLSIGGTEYTFDDGAEATAEVACAAPPVDCTYNIVMTDPGSWAEEITWTISNAAGEVVMSGDTTTEAQVLEGADGETFTLTMIDSFGDGWNGGVISINGNEYTLDDGAEGTVEFVCDALSVNENNILEMTVYPNPVDQGIITILTPIDGERFVELFDVNGRKVLETTINGNTLDVSSINSGFYMLKVTVNGQSNVSKLIVR